MQQHASIQSGFFILGRALATALFSIALFGFPQFHLGYWNAEPISLAMFSISAVTACWLAAGIYFRFFSFPFPRGNSLVYLWCAWLVWQAVCTAFSPSPWRSWFGPPEQGEGLAWYLCASVFMLQLSVLWSSEHFRRYLFTYSFALMLILATLHFISDEQNNLLAGFIFLRISAAYFAELLPFVWPDYLGYMAGWWWVALMLTYRGLRLRLLLVLGICTFFILFASSNQVACVLVGYAMLITLTIRLIHACGLLHFTHISRTWRNLVVLAMCLPLLWLFASPWITAGYSPEQSRSIPTRILINHITLAAIAEEPSHLLLGKGWGQFADDFFKSAMVRDIRVYDDGRHNPNWVMIRGYNYHTHNMSGETLLALGLVGFLLWLFMPIIAARKMPDAFFWAVSPMLVAVTVLQHFWFPLPQTMPLQALCWFLLMRMAFKSPPPTTNHQPLIAASCLALATALIWSASAQYQTICYDMQMADPFGERYGTAVTQRFMEEDIKRGGDRLRTFFISTSKRMAKNQQNIEAKHITLYRMYLGAAANMARSPSIGAYNGQAVLYGYNMLLTSLRTPEFDEFQQPLSQDYPDIARRHTARAPDREDVIAPFLRALYDSKQDRNHKRLMQMVGELLAVHPMHRSALWLGGKVLSEQEEFKLQGREMMRIALQLGADRVFLIKKSEIKALQE